MKEVEAVGVIDVGVEINVGRLVLILVRCFGLSLGLLRRFCRCCSRGYVWGAALDKVLLSRVFLWRWRHECTRYVRT